MPRDSWYDAWKKEVGRDASFEFDVGEDGVQVSSDLDARGRELPDPVPMSPPVGFRAGASLSDFVQHMIRTEVSRRAQEAEMETFDEADDFEVDDEMDHTSPWEEYFDPNVKLSSYDPRYKAAIEEYVRSQQEAARKKTEGGGGGDSPPSGKPSSGLVEPAPAPSGADAKPAPVAKSAGPQ